MTRFVRAMACSIILFLPLAVNAAMWEFSGGLNIEQRVAADAMPGDITVPDPYFGGGFVMATLDDVSGLFTWEYSFGGLSGPAGNAYFHEEEAGVGGGVAVGGGVWWHERYFFGQHYTCCRPRSGWCEDGAHGGRFVCCRRHHQLVSEYPHRAESYRRTARPIIRNFGRANPGRNLVDDLCARCACWRTPLYLELEGHLEKTPPTAGFFYTRRIKR